MILVIWKALNQAVLRSVDIAEGNDLGDCINFVEDDDLGERIASWAVKHNFTRDCTNYLLKIQEFAEHSKNSGV